MSPRSRAIACLAVGAVFSCALAWAQDCPVQFERKPGEVRILVAETLFARYVYEDTEIHRPYFCDLHTLDGIQVTRNHPPIEGKDPTDHAQYHPGLWLAFGDIDGADDWRNKTAVKHLRFVENPQPGVLRGFFSVENAYLDAQGTELCRETVRYKFIPQAHGCLILHDSEFYTENRDFVFGDQEEMGLGLRVATPMMVTHGGTIINSHGARNEEGTWGRTAEWCAYQGEIDGIPVGIGLIPHPDSFRPAWFHARDYGLLVANAFGRNAFTGAEKSQVRIKRGERFPLRFGIYVYNGTAECMPAIYEVYVEQSKANTPEPANENL